jgi:hypothetical protein
VRVERERKKKLIVAFHFVYANESVSRGGWNCDSCRRHGLEKKRRCGFLPSEQRGEARIVWGRHGAHAQECPKSLITAESLTLIEEFLVGRRLGMQNGLDMDARKADAFLILQEETEREQRNGTA